ncbi:MAG: hypothetical protein U9N04_03995 [Patescibacteria group bacterium]|nr:hypothetical protein [Patescibacteria group bacterium]
MNKQSFENSSVNLENKTEFDREKLAELSKSEILELIEKTPESKNEILKEIPNKVYWSEGVDQNVLESCEFSEKNGFKVGSVEVEDRKTGKIIKIDLYCKREKSHYNLVNHDQIEKYFYKYNLLDEKRETVASMNIKNFSDDLIKILIENHSEKLLKEKFNISKNLLKYGNDLSEKPKSFIHVDTIQSFKEERFGGCGTALHQVAVEHSLREGFKGRAQLYADYLGSSTSEDNVVVSTGFHENFGYFYKDIYNYNRDGELRHKGEKIHVALAESRWKEAEEWKKEHPGEKIAKTIRDKYRPFADKSMLIASLPEEIILREKKRMLKHQNLQVNLETLDALEKNSSHK